MYATPLVVHSRVPLAILLVLAGSGAAVLLGLGLAAVARRQSRSYLLVALALATLFSRSVVAALALTDVFGSRLHHLVEHGLDVAMVALVIGAVYYARTIETSATRGENR